MAVPPKKSTKYEAVAVRHVDKDDAKIINSFVGLCKVENVDAAGLCYVISKCLQDAGIQEWQKKLICLTVDGASVNIERHNGLVKLMDSPIYIHCFNHVLDLCFKESIKSNVAASKSMTLLKTVSSFYRTSPELTRELFHAGEAFDLNLLTFKAVCETRWANSLESCVSTIARNYPAVVQHLTDITSPHAPSRYTNNVKALQRDCFLNSQHMKLCNFFFYAFSDFVSVFSEASKHLEKADLNILDATECIKEIQINLVDFGPSGDLRSSNKKNLLSFLTSIDDTQLKIIMFKNIELKKQKGKKNSQLEDSFKELCLKASSSVNKCFFNNNGASVIVQTAKILNTAYFLTGITDSSDFGENEIGEFSTLFNIPIDRVLAEWRELCAVMSEHFRPSVSLNDLFVKLQTDAFKTMRLLAEAVEIISTIPASNAEVKRIWSSVTHTLNDKSLSMGQETLEYRLQIKKSKVSLEKFYKVQIYSNKTIPQQFLVAV